MKNQIRNTTIVTTLLFAFLISACASTPPVTSETQKPKASTQVPKEIKEKPLGTKDSPMNIGDKRELDFNSAYTVSVEAVNTDAEAQLKTEDEFYDPPAEGKKHVLVSLAIELNEESLLKQQPKALEEGLHVGAALFVDLVDVDGRSYRPFEEESFCHVKDDLLSQPPVYSADIITKGKICFTVPSDKVKGIKAHITNFNKKGVWVNLD